MKYDDNYVSRLRSSYRHLSNGNLVRLRDIADKAIQKPNPSEAQYYFGIVKAQYKERKELDIPRSANIEAKINILGQRLKRLPGVTA